MAALTITTGTATEVNTPQSVSAFVPTAEAHSFQPHVTTLSSPSVDAKQQLQRKIQRKQQEQKLHSPLPGEGQTKRADDGVPCASPAPPSPQPTIGIVVAAVPSPITVQKSRQLMSPSPMGTVENKVLPINFQMVTQPVQAVKQSPKSPQNILASPVGERTARQRYAQILPKPSATTAITLRSPSTMIIANSPIKTVMTTCHVSPVSLVKMTAISLAPNSSNTTTSLSNTSLRPESAGISSSAENSSYYQSMRITSAAPLLAPVATPGQIANTHTNDVEMEIEAIHENSQRQSPSCLTQGAMVNKAAGAVQRAASVPIPQTRGFLGLEETSSSNCNEKSYSSTNTVVAAQSSNNSINNRSTLHLTPPTQKTSAVSLLNTSRTPSFGESSNVSSAKEGFSSTKSLRKRLGLSPDLSPVKRIFMPQQAAEGTAGLGYGVRNVVSSVPRPGAPVRPESAPAPREVETKMNSASSTQVHALCTSSFIASGFYSVAKTQSSMPTKNTSTVMETSTSASHTLLQQQQGHTVANVHAIPTNPSLQKHLGVSDVRSSTTGSLEGVPQQTYTQSNPAPEPLDFFNQAQSSSQLPMQTDMDYFPFDDDVTQDSIVEELVQMEEQMKLNNLQEFGGGVTLHGQQAMMTDNVMSTNQTMAAFYHAANSHSNPIQTPTPTPTPTPTSEMIGGVQGLTGESPCSHITSTTPVDSVLGSSHHTPVGTPHSNSSSNVPPSPVECRNPFAFTPINSSITSFHDGSTVSSSPVKPMQRPMATHPDKTRLEWMNNSYNISSSGSLNKSNSGMGIVPSYHSLIGDHFQKPHAFAIPHARHHDSHFGHLTPISPVQQQVASMTNMSKQEGFAVPAPLDNKASNTPVAASRCRSVSPAVHQRNLSGNTGNLPYIPRLVVSPFNSPVTPEVLNIFANSQTNLGVSSMAQRSHSVPLNIMMQTEVLPTPGQQCNSKNITNVLLSKLDGDHDDTVRGLGINNLPSSYTAHMNLTQILESNPNLSCTDNHLSLMTSDSTSTCKLQRPSPLMENAIDEQMILSAGDSGGQAASGEQHRQQAQSMLLPLSSQQHQQLDFSSTVKDLLTDSSLTAGSQLMEQVSELSTDGQDFPCEIRMTSELSSSINDLNTLDTNLLFDPNQQQGQYQNAAAEELVNNQLFQQITSEAAHSGGLDWLESKDHPTVGLMG